MHRDSSQRSTEEGLTRCLGGYRLLLLKLMTLVRCLGPTWWKERTPLLRWSYYLHMCVWHLYLHLHMCTIKIIKKAKVNDCLFIVLHGDNKRKKRDKGILQGVVSSFLFSLIPVCLDTLENSHTPYISDTRSIFFHHYCFALFLPFCFLGPVPQEEPQQMELV